MSKFEFPVGYHHFHSDIGVNFQLNRWHSGGLARYEDCKEVGSKVKNYLQWKTELMNIGKKAEAEGRLANAFIYYRAAEFFVYPSDPDKDFLYNKCITLFNKAFKDDEIKRYEVPFEGGALPILQLPAKNKKGTILLHGGYDSFNEEFYPLATLALDRGYEVIMFEGPGQGGALHRYGLKITPEWEKPTKAVLDYFNLTDVTLVGVSLGGYLAARAAAFERRITRVVLYDIIYDFFAAMMSRHPFTLRTFITTALKLHLRPIINAMEKKIRAKDLFSDWLISHGFYVYGVNNLFDYFKMQQKFNTIDISPLIKQDVLMLGGTDDHYTQFFDQQRNALTNAKSVTGRIFTREEHASYHCQVGNLKLAMDYILDWIDQKC